MYSKVSDSLVKLADSLVVGGKLTEVVKELKGNPAEVKKVIDMLKTGSDKEAGAASKAFLAGFLALLAYLPANAWEPLKTKMTTILTSEEVNETSLKDIMKEVIIKGIENLKKTKKESDVAKLEREIEKQSIAGYIEKSEAEKYLAQISKIMAPAKA